MPEKFTDIEEEILSEAPADTTAPLDRDDDSENKTEDEPEDE